MVDTDRDPRDDDFEPNWPTRLQVFSPGAVFEDGRRRVLDRDGAEWSIGRLVRQVDGDRRRAVRLLDAELRRTA